ncbi:MAG: peptidylprolyl isomerase, partial [Venatoribacter sp.]
MLKKLFALGLFAFSMSSSAAVVYSAQNPAHKAIDTNGIVKVVMHTSEGNIDLDLNYNKAPISVLNFLKYAESGHYNGTIFHRVIKDFMIQGGGFDTNMTQKPTQAPIKNEAQNGLRNVRGSIAMARTPMIDSATSQFFINTKDNRFLDNGVRDFGYAVFGFVAKGMDVVDKIENTPMGMRDVPIKPIVIQSIKVIVPPPPPPPP